MKKAIFTHSSLFLSGIVLAISLFLPYKAFAEGFALYEFSARGIALGGAMMARKPDASAIAYNPALITKLKGARIMSGMSALLPSGKIKSFETDGSSLNTNVKPSTWFIPHAYYTQQLSDDWYFGVGEFSRFGLGFEYPHNWPGRFNIYEVALTSMSVNPNIAWAATDKLSLAAGVEVVYVNLDIKKRANVPVPGTGTAFEVDSNIQDAHDTGVGFNLAGHYQFNDQWAIGLLYRSQVRIHAKGDVKFSYLGSEGVSALPPPAQAGIENAFKENFKDGKAHSTVILPDSIGGGIAWTPTPKLSFEAGATWTRWSLFRGLNIHLPDPVGVSNSPKHWRDAWRFNFGVEYEALDWLDLRAGYTYDQSPMTASYQDYLVPTAGRNIYSAGLGFKVQDWTIDLGYAFVDAKDRSYKTDLDPSGTHVVRSKTQDASTHVMSVSIGYEF